MNINEVLADIRNCRKKKVILDTDTYNEIDDQFALAWAVLENGKKIDLLSVNAAPFFNSRSTSPKDGMEKSYNEIANILSLIESSGLECAVKPTSISRYRGSEGYLPDRKTPLVTEASENIVKTVSESNEIVYVVAIGAITNVASAILTKPEIVNNMVVVWLGGHAWNAPHTREFNMVQDVAAAQVVLDSKVPFVQIPCAGVCDYLTTTVPELKAYLSGRNALCDYLADIVEGYASGNTYCWSKVIWDISAFAVLFSDGYAEKVVMPTPILTSDCLYAFDNARHHMILVRALRRDRIFADMFDVLSAGKSKK